jgi:hypothetical protein
MTFTARPAELRGPMEPRIDGPIGANFMPERDPEAVEKKDTEFD